MTKASFEELRARASETPEAQFVDLERQEVDLHVMSDQHVFEAEMSRIFARTWNFIGHESEVPKPGDFVTRYMGNMSVILIRHTDGSLRVLANRCTHKGAMLCREDRGQRNRFVCPYHGFSFNRDGSFFNMPYRKELYNDVDTSEYNLPSARVETVAGLAFANWDPEAPDLRTYLGPYLSVIKATFERGDNGMEVIGPPQRWVLPTNWKTVTEQFSGDGYHAGMTHTTVMDPEGSDGAQQGVDMAANGHGMRCIDLAAAWGGDSKVDAGTPEEQLRARPPAGMTPAMIDSFLTRATAGEIEMLVNFPPSVGNIFPTCTWMRAQMPHTDGTIITYTDIKLARPLSATETEIWGWGLVERDSDPDHNDKALKVRTVMFGPAGSVERDDVDMWVRIQAAVNGATGMPAIAKYRALWEPDAEDLVPGMKTWRGYSGENTAWEFWNRWRDFMNNRPWSAA